MTESSGLSGISLSRAETQLVVIRVGWQAAAPQSAGSHPKTTHRDRAGPSTKARPSVILKPRATIDEAVRFVRGRLPHAAVVRLAIGVGLVGLPVPFRAID